MAVGEDACEVTIARTVARLAYVRFIRDWNIWRAPGPAGDQGLGATRFIYSTRADVLGSFSPDGDHIAFVSTRSGHRSLWTCDGEGQNCRDYQVRPAVESLRWSPDGRRIAFAGWDPDTAKLDVYTGDVDTGFTRNVTAGIASDGEPSWSHDGHWMYFSSNRTGEFQVWKMPSDGGAAVQITKRGGFRSFESDDGRWLYYCNPVPTGGVWRMPVDGGAEVQLLARQLACTDWALWKENLLYFAVAAPGRGLSFEPRVGRDEGPSIEIMDLNTGHARRLRPLATTSRHLAVSSDGRWLLYSQDDGTIGDLMLVDDFH
jgi:Tol biopolymer transport system component